MDTEKIDSSIYLRLEGDEAEGALRSLYAWLLNDRKVIENASVSLVSQPVKPGEMGASLDAVKLVVDNGFQTLNLALAYAAWRRTRRERPPISIEIRNTRTPLPGSDREVIDQIVRVLDENGEE